MQPALRMHPDLLFVSLCGLIQLAVYSRLRHIYLSCAFTQAGSGFTLRARRKVVKNAPNCYTVYDSNVQFLDAVRTNGGGKRLQTAILSTILHCDSL